MNDQFEKLIKVKNGKSFILDFVDLNLSIEQQLDNLREDMGWISYNDDEFVIDFGWTPSFDINGSFNIYVIKESDWDNPLIKKKCKDCSKLVDLLQECIENIENLIIGGDRKS